MQPMFVDLIKNVMPRTAGERMAVPEDIGRRMIAEGVAVAGPPFPNVAPAPQPAAPAAPTQAPVHVPLLHPHRGNVKNYVRK